jgi:hypothetical protein
MHSSPRRVLSHQRASAYSSIQSSPSCLLILGTTEANAPRQASSGVAKGEALRRRPAFFGGGPVALRHWARLAALAASSTRSAVRQTWWTAEFAPPTLTRLSHLDLGTWLLLVLTRWRQRISKTGSSAAASMSPSTNPLGMPRAALFAARTAPPLQPDFSRRSGS